MQTLSKTSGLILGALLLSGCSSIIYKHDVQQGNVITPDMVSQLKPGMTTAQVRYVMGTPVLAHTFNPDRWDYVSYYQPNHGKRIRENVSLTFSHDVLKKIETSHA